MAGYGIGTRRRQGLQTLILTGLAEKLDLAIYINPPIQTINIF